MPIKKYICNWTKLGKEFVGGVETMQDYLNKAIPNSSLVSSQDMFEISARSFEEYLKDVDRYYCSLFEKNKNILIIRDAEFGGITDISNIPQIIIFENPYLAIQEKKLITYKDLSYAYKYIKNAKKVAVSNFMKFEMKKIGLKPDYIIPNCVDTDYFKPVKNKKALRKKYNLENKRTGIWVGDASEVKNFQMLLNVIDEFKEINWILVTKTKFPKFNSNCKVFTKVSKETVRDLYNCADFFILTSPVESFGLTIIEAMAINLPCIISKVGYFWDFWDDRIGIQVSSDSFKEHKEAIESINKIKTNSRQVLIEQKLDFKSYKKKWNEVLNG